MLADYCNAFLCRLVRIHQSACLDKAFDYINKIQALPQLRGENLGTIPSAATSHRLIRACVTLMTELNNSYPESNTSKPRKSQMDQAEKDALQRKYIGLTEKLFQEYLQTAEPLSPQLEGADPAFDTYESEGRILLNALISVYSHAYEPDKAIAVLFSPSK